MQLSRAAILLQEVDAECSEVAFGVDVGASTHEGTYNQLGVILKEVDLRRAKDRKT